MADFVDREITVMDEPGPLPGSHHPRSESFRSRAGETTIMTEDIGHDVTRLYTTVETAMMNMPAPSGGDNNTELRPTEVVRMKEMLCETWESIREWLAAHPSMTDRQQAAMHQGQFLTTALHMVCKLMDPPVDVVQSLIDCAVETVMWPDSNGWLPLHHACANGATGKVLSVLVQAYPEGKVHQDKRLRTPLHFAFFRKDAPVDQTSGVVNPDGHSNENMNRGGDDMDNDNEDVGNSMPDIVALLADSGAAELQDEGGMLPMHYACAYGTTREVLQVLLENYPESTTKRENKGRNALHLAMVNAHRKSSPKVVGFLLEKNAAEIINSYDNEHHLPIHLLAMASRNVQDRENAIDCLKLYLKAKPKATADFLTAIQTLPEWLRDIAVISDHIQDILNHKIVMRFPTTIMMMDFIVNILVIIMFEFASKDTIDYLFDKDNDSIPQEMKSTPAHKGYSIVTLVCGFYFLLREMFQIISLLLLGTIGSWVFDPLNWLDVLLICLIFFNGTIMLMNDTLISLAAFRTGAAITKAIMWLAVIFFLKSARVEFSVFVSGVYNVIQKLATYMVALIIILLMFAQMFYIMYFQQEECVCSMEYEEAIEFPHCGFLKSFMKVITMLMGEIGDEMRYSNHLWAQILYIMFAFLVVILLSNVLIAIVTDAYGVIRNERAAMVFWSNRLDFVAEMDAIKNVGKIIMTCFRSSEGAAGAPTRVQETPNGEPIPIDDSERKDVSRFRDGWDSLWNLFGPNLYETYDANFSSFEFWCYVLVQIVALFVIPFWFILGAATAGLLWPPQVREYILKQKKVAINRADIADQVTEQMNDLQSELKKLRAEMKSEMKCDRKEFSVVKADVVAVQAEVMADLLQVKEIMVLLLNMSKERLDPVG